MYETKQVPRISIWRADNSAITTELRLITASLTEEERHLEIMGGGGSETVTTEGKERRPRSRNAQVYNR
jgi:hypothetical protein